MNYKIAISALGLLLLAVTSCKKDEKPVGGKGGNATLNITTKHHSIFVPDTKIYIKYNTLEKPAGSFDDSVTTTWTNDKPLGSFSGLKKGDYYIYGTGYDTAVAREVVGGQGYTIENENAQEITLYITEGD